MDSKQNGSQGKAMQQLSDQPVLNRTVQAQLGRRLRVMFEGEVEPVPDKFEELIAQLDRKLKSRNS